MKKITLAIVDDHKLIRQMWARMFETIDHVEIVGQSGELDDAVEMIKDKRPDIVLLDINLDRKSGMDAIPVIRKYSPGTRVIVVSMHNQIAYVKHVMNLGAKGYVTKNSSEEEMIKAVTIVTNGDEYICVEIQEMMVKQLLHDEPKNTSIENLSMREIEILKNLKQGLTSKEIAATLHISVRTVETHRHNVLKKLELKNTAALINFLNNTDLNFI